jgi:hypothetical protein
MYSLLRQLPPRTLLLVQTPSFLAAFVIAEMFYKWHSFTLECFGFLATWFVLDFLITQIMRLVRGDKAAAGSKG